MKNFLKKTYVFLSVFLNLILISEFIINIPCNATDGVIYIDDPMLLKALNVSLKNSLVNGEQGGNNKQKQKSRGDFDDIFESDIVNVLRLDASNLGITDIEGLEKFTSITSTIDLSNNNISDITPLINWVKNKKANFKSKDEQLEANIFLGGNQQLFGQNYQQIYMLSGLGDHIYIYDSPRPGEGVVELPGFVNGRPVEIGNTSEQHVVSAVDSDGELNSDFDDSQNQGNQSEILNTGKNIFFTYFLSILTIVVLFMIFFKYKKLDD